MLHFSTIMLYPPATPEQALALAASLCLAGGLACDGGQAIELPRNKFN